MQVGAAPCSATAQICSQDSVLYLVFQLSFQAVSDPELLKPPQCGVMGVSPQGLNCLLDVSLM